MTYLLGVILALGSAICWAIEPSLFVLGMRDTPPLLANAIRTLTAGIFSLFMVILWEDLGGHFPFDWIQVGVLIGITFVGMGFGDWLYLKCLEHTEVSFVVGLTNAYPLFVAIFAIFLGTETLSLLSIIASLIIVSGVILISTTQNTSIEQRANPILNPPISMWKTHVSTLFTLLVAFSWAFTIFGMGLSLRYFTPLSANGIRVSAVGGLLFLIFIITPPSNNYEKKSSRHSIILLGGGGIIGLGLGAWMMLWSIELLGATRSAALLSVSPLFSALIAILILKEKPTRYRFGGILLVCLGVLLMSIS